MCEDSFCILLCCDHIDDTFMFVFQTVQTGLLPPMHKVLDPKRVSTHPTGTTVLVAIFLPSTSLPLWNAARTLWPLTISLVFTPAIHNAPALAPPEPPPPSRRPRTSHHGAPALTRPLPDVAPVHLPLAQPLLHLLLRMAANLMAGEQPDVCCPDFSLADLVRNPAPPPARSLIRGQMTLAQMKPHPVKPLLQSVERIWKQS